MRTRPRRGRSGGPGPHVCLSPRGCCERKRRGVSGANRRGTGTECGALGGVAREFRREFVRQRDIILLQHLLLRRLGVAQRDERERLAGRREAVVVDGRDLGADGEGEAALDVLQPMEWRNGVSKGGTRGGRWTFGCVLHVVEHNRLEVALLLRRAVEGRELLRLDCEGEWWAARERGVGLKGKRQRFEARVVQIDLSASGDGAQVPLAFWRHRSGKAGARRLSTRGCVGAH